MFDKNVHLFKNRKLSPHFLTLRNEKASEEELDLVIENTCVFSLVISVLCLTFHTAKPISLHSYSTTSIIKKTKLNK
jgi:hypothetical protein